MVHKKKISYFSMLLIAFLFISTTPIAIISSSVLFFTRQSFNNDMNKYLNDYSKKKIDYVNNTLQEYEDIIKAIAYDHSVINVMSSHDEAQITGTQNKLKTYITGRKDKIEIHIISLDERLIMSTGKVPNLYSIKTYGDWGIFRKINYDKTKTVISAASYGGSKSNDVSFTMGTAVLNERNELVGYVLIDFYRNYISEMLRSVAKEQAITDFILIDSNSIIIIDMTDPTREGMALSKQKMDKFKQGLFGNVIVGVGQNNFSMSSVYDIEKELSLISLVNIDGYVRLFNNLKYIVTGVVLITVSLCILSAFIIANKMSKPIKLLLKSMNEVQNGNLDEQIVLENINNAEIYTLGNNYNIMLNRIKQLLTTIVEEHERLNVAELKALQAQISPHFFYNMLNDIKSLAKFGRTDDISTLVVQLGKLLRSNIDKKSEYITVKEDIELIKSYLDIQIIRLDHSIEVEINTDSLINNEYIPRLILQPIVENAVLHGLSEKEHGGKIVITTVLKDELMEFSVFDNGKGVIRDVVEYINNGENNIMIRMGIGLENVQKRLKLYYGDNYGIKIESVEGQFTKVIVTIPIKATQQNNSDR